MQLADRVAVLIANCVHRCADSSPPFLVTNSGELSTATKTHPRPFFAKPAKTSQRFVHVPHRGTYVTFVRPLGEQSVVVSFVTVDHVGNNGKVKRGMTLQRSNPIVERSPIRYRLPAGPRREGAVIESVGLTNANCCRLEKLTNACPPLMASRAAVAGVIGRPW